MENVPNSEVPGELEAEYTEIEYIDSESQEQNRETPQNIETASDPLHQTMANFETAIVNGDPSIMREVANWLEDPVHFVMHANAYTTSADGLQPHEAGRFAEVLMTQLLASQGSSAETFNKWAPFPQYNKFPAVDALLSAIQSGSVGEAKAYLEQATAHFKK